MTTGYTAAKATVGVVLAVLLGCDPVPGNETDAGTEASVVTTVSGLQPIGADKLCQKLIGECGLGYTQSECLNIYFPLRVTASCVNAIANASCADITGNTSTVATTCFPKCAVGTAPVCNADGTITMCTASSATNIRDCRDSCTSDGYTAWTGSCGNTFDGLTAAQQQCWCR